MGMSECGCVCVCVHVRTYVRALTCLHMYVHGGALDN